MRVGGMLRVHDGAVGFALVCEEREVAVGQGAAAHAAFVPMGKNRFWVLKTVGGAGAVKGDLQHANLLESLHADLREGRGERLASLPSPEKEKVRRAVARVSEADARPDPMLELTTSLATPARTPKKVKGHPRGSLVSLCVAKSPRPDEAETQKLLVYESRHGALFVHAEALPWILHYLYEETQGAAIPEPTDADEGPLDDDRPWVTRWCPTGAWHVEIKAGALKGRKWCSRVADLTEAKWAAGASVLSLQTPLQVASPAEKKDVLLAYLEQLVATALEQQAQTA